jgi:hypothetical protein
MKLDKIVPLALMCLTLLLVGCSGELPDLPTPSHDPEAVSVVTQDDGTPRHFLPTEDFHEVPGVNDFVWWEVIRAQGTQAPFMLLITPTQKDEITKLLGEKKDFVVTIQVVRYKTSLTQLTSNPILFLNEIVLQK